LRLVCLSVTVTLLLLLTVPVIAEKSKPDIGHSERIIFEVEGKGSKLELTSEIRTVTRYISRQSTEHAYHYVYDGWLAEVHKIVAHLDHQKIGKRDRWTEGLEDVGEFSPRSRVHVLRLDRLKRGSELVCRSEATYRSAFHFPIVTIPNLNRLEGLEVVVKHPERMTVEFDFFWPRDSVEVQVQSLSASSTKLKIGRVDFVPEISLFRFNEIHGLIRPRLLREGTTIVGGDAKQFVDWLANLYTLTPEIDSSFDWEGNGLPDRQQPDSLVLAGINRWLQEQVRYVADQRDEHEIIPHPADTVCIRKFGDCLDKANLFCALARAAGIEAYLACVGAEPVRRFENPHINEFHHAIVAVEQEGEWLFCDPTDRYSDFGYVSEKIVGHPVLVLKPDEPEWQTLRSVGSFPTLTVAVESSADSLEYANAVVTFEHGQVAAINHFRHHYSQTKVENYMSEYLSSLFAQMPFGEFTLKDEAANSLTFGARVDLSRFVTVAGAKLFVPRAPFRLFDRSVLERADDSLPVHLGVRIAVNLTLDLKGASPAPGDTTGVELDAGPMEYKIGVEQQGDSATVLNYRFVISNAEVQAGERAALVGGFSDYFALKNEMITLVREGIGQ